MAVTNTNRDFPASIVGAPWLAAPTTQRVLACLNQHGHKARAVGGCVRNTLLAALSDATSATAPRVTDIDIATTSIPEETMRLAEASGMRTVPTGLQHGTITVIANDEPFEVTTLRRDVTTDGRRAEVAFTDDWALDAARRDLTINALYANADGTVFDPLGGYPDLIARRIRFVGEPAQRIREDYLRILRFFRFYAEYGRGPIDEAGLHACVAGRVGLARLSPERIHQELVKLLLADQSFQTLDMMAAHGLLTEVLPVAPNLKRFASLAAFDDDRDAALRLAALSMHVSEDAGRLASRLRLSRNETAVLKLTGEFLDRLQFRSIDETSARRTLYKHGLEAYIRLVKISRAINQDEKNATYWQDMATLPDRWIPPLFPIAGNDLICMGATPGIALGALLKELETRWIDSGFALSREALLDDARRRLEASD